MGAFGMRGGSEEAQGSYLLDAKRLQFNAAKLPDASNRWEWALQIASFEDDNGAKREKVASLLVRALQ